MIRSDFSEGDHSISSDRIAFDGGEALKDSIASYVTEILWLQGNGNFIHLVV
ncbi:hypothetical protein BC477_04940 [Clavibacter michiganensis subsp. michiganensis]|uniref:Uncharacterized protein n=1 Tax=Clavibacter michiganensis subsp. michiganensis TaxID=33013 RepID=A0A251XKS4_CLAMM|nr:hypothetical protein BC477_04940 [Clavibacter michiganensis subsp. michiganensis]OUE04061.1 hypothetical protein CMMCAS07_03870 [Clavibacter michiganensis subsp. michiganensis]